ncbi:MAG: glycine zipper 2TM domain-containing protein [Pseudomonadota bacterium]
MRSSHRFGSAIVSVVMVAGLAACAAPPGPTYPAGTAYPSGSAYPAGNAYPTSTAPSAAVEYGRITNVEVVRTQAPAGSNAAGTIIGGIAGAVIGHQIGQGRGRDLATIAGGVGGAVAGNAIQRNANGGGAVTDVYRVSVQVDSGAYRAYDLSNPGDLRAGDRVRVENGQIQRI